MAEDLDEYEVPKEVYVIEKFIETNQKVQRLKTLELLK